MTAQSRFNLNLASHPYKNRRVFILIAAFLGIFFLLLAGIGGSQYFKYRGLNQQIRTAVGEIDENSRNMQREAMRHQTMIDSAKTSFQAKVDYVNSIIYKKSFPWLDFLLTLEKSLPDSCYIVSMSPNIEEDSYMMVRFQVAAPSLKELLQFITNLNKMNLDQISLISENQNKSGLLVTEITLRYERTI